MIAPQDYDAAPTARGVEMAQPVVGEILAAFTQVEIATILGRIRFPVRAHFDAMCRLEEDGFIDIDRGCESMWRTTLTPMGAALRNDIPQLVADTIGMTPH
jgi:hypothetical protein